MPKPLYVPGAMSNGQSRSEAFAFADRVYSNWQLVSIALSPGPPPLGASVNEMLTSVAFTLSGETTQLPSVTAGGGASRAVAIGGVVVGSLGDGGSVRAVADGPATTCATACTLLPPPLSGTCIAPSSPHAATARTHHTQILVAPIRSG